MTKKQNIPLNHLQDFNQLSKQHTHTKQKVVRVFEKLKETMNRSLVHISLPFPFFSASTPAVRQDRDNIRHGYVQNHQ